MDGIGDGIDDGRRGSHAGLLAALVNDQAHCDQHARGHGLVNDIAGHK